MRQEQREIINEFRIEARHGDPAGGIFIGQPIPEALTIEQAIRFGVWLLVTADPSGAVLSRHGLWIEEARPEAPPETLLTLSPAQDDAITAARWEGIEARLLSLIRQPHHMRIALERLARVAAARERDTPGAQTHAADVWRQVAILITNTVWIGPAEMYEPRPRVSHLVEGKPEIAVIEDIGSKPEDATR